MTDPIAEALRLLKMKNPPADLLDKMTELEANVPKELEEIWGDLMEAAQALIKGD